MSKKIVRKLKFQGLDVSIETDKGQERKWYDPNTGEKGITKLEYPYGYVCRTEGNDGEQIDCFVGPNEDVDTVYIIHQNKAPDFKVLDEDKIFLGFESAKQARLAYLSHYNDKRFYDSMDEMPVSEFKEKFVKKAFDQNIANVNQAMLLMPTPTVDELWGVDHFLNSFSSMNDKKILSLANEIWGEGYQFVNRTPEQIKMEVLGFLLDQKEYLELIQQTLNQVPSDVQDSEDSSENSTDMSNEMDQSADGISDDSE